ncbi:hypothetical protein I6N90_17750 [Paenibacillus sp. GSMTC-2017]|uniref:hypothetical protein n=1 Tax=Paenibacillus sp. GSMTC-2017 TaxID=2794350 RepID=UPI0018D9236D|nr:hypothetical protein [Paenibacillus sp. GSMTC-2017]MBH5319643.1 hypothetical protein [Paenibacillus sp. GSMTC-2017]
MDSSILKDWIQKHDIHRRTIEAFWLNFNSYREEYPEEFEDVFFQYSSDKLKIFVENISLNLKDFAYLGPENGVMEYIEAKVRIEYRSVEVAYYRLIFSHDGEVEDDYFFTDWKGERPYLLMSALDDLVKEMDKKARTGEITPEESERLKGILSDKKRQTKESYFEQFSIS